MNTQTIQWQRKHIAYALQKIFEEQRLGVNLDINSINAEFKNENISNIIELIRLWLTKKDDNDLLTNDKSPYNYNFCNQINNPNTYSHIQYMCGLLCKLVIGTIVNKPVIGSMPFKDAVTELENRYDQLNYYANPYN